MTDKHCVSFMKLVALFGILTMLLLPGAVHARGAFPELVAPGQCTISPVGTARLVARKSQDSWQIALEVIGPTSVGDWTIRFAKNSVWGTPSLVSFPPPGGWAFAGANTSAADRGNVVTFSVEATNLGTSNVCTASIGFKVR
jgi:hypothetical protein